MLQPLQLSRTHVTSTNDKDPALQLVICSRMGREQSLLLFLGFLRWWGGEPLMYVRTSPPPEPSTCSWLYPSFLHYLVTPAFTVIRHSPPLLKESAGPPPSGPRPPGKGTLGTVLRSVGFVQRKKAGICGVGPWHSRAWTTSWSDTYFIWQKSHMSGNKFLLFKKQCSSCAWLGKSSNTE